MEPVNWKLYYSRRESTQRRNELVLYIGDNNYNMLKKLFQL